MLPISYGFATDEKYRIQTRILTDKEARKKAVLHIQQFEKKLLKKDIEVMENKVKTKTDQENCTASGNLVVIEKTGIRVPVEKRGSNILK